MMNSNKLWTYFALALLWAAGGCDGMVERPRPGSYRAVLELQGAELPVQLEIADEQGVIRLWLISGARRSEATRVTVDQGRLQARLPDGAGSLDVEIHRKSLTGALTLAGASPVQLPFEAKHGETWHFYRESLTDNADVSGAWQLDCGSNARWTLALEQTHDQVSGEIQATEQRLAAVGQVHGDEVHLAGIGAHTAWLYRGQVDATGALQGELLDSAGRHLRCNARE